MSSTLFAMAAPRDSTSTQYHPGVTTTQADNSGPPPPGPSSPSKPQGEWLCDEPYKYFIKSSKNPLEMCNEIVERHDENAYRRLKDEINFLMVVAGLFLAIVAAFTVESYKFLQEDKQDTMSELLFEVVRLLNDTSAQGKAQLPKPFKPTHYAIVVNSIWFLSMILDLIAVAMGTFCLQWISTLSRGSDLTEKSIPPHESLALRQLRHEGLVRWGVRHAPEVLLLLVQLAIGLFTCGLLYLLWNVNETTTLPALVVTCVAGALLCSINVFPFLQPLVGAFIPATLTVPQCPYKSPISWLAHSAGNVLLYVFKLCLNNKRILCSVGTVGRLGRWLESLPLILTDFNWKKYDAMCQRLRTDVRSPLSYFESGLISALDHFPYEGTKDILSSYLENLVPFIATAQDWVAFSQQDLSNDETRFLDGKYALMFQLLPHRLNTIRLQLEYADKIRVDFLSALVLQHFTGHNDGYTHLLLHRRIELYIRVKNSIEFISGGAADFGKSLRCPFESDLGIGELDLELKFQFLLCVKYLIDIRRFSDLDILSAAAIIRENGTGTMITFSPNIPNLPETQHRDPPAKEGLEGLRPDQSSPIRNPGDEPDPGTASSPPNGTPISPSPNGELAFAPPSTSESIAHANIEENPRPGDPLMITSPPTIPNLSGTQHMDSPAREEQERLRPDQSSPIRNPSDEPDPGTASSPPIAMPISSSANGGPAFAPPDGSESIAHANIEENPRLRDSLASLCSQVLEQVLRLRPRDFQDLQYYIELRNFFGLPLYTSRTR